MGFEQVIEFVLAHEGGYVRDPVDKGGETQWGISNRAYPSLDIRNLTREKAIEIYKRDYWDLMSCQMLPPDVAFVVMDTGVNCGTYRAGVLLQMACNTVLRSAGIELFVDGLIGSKTIASANMRSGEGIAGEMLLKRLAFYRGLVKRDMSQSKFLGGWLNRVIDLYQEIRK